MKTLTGYHFTGDRLRDGSPIPKVGEWLAHKGEVIVCESGLHMSEHPFDALQYAPGYIIHRVELRGDLQPHGDPTDKWAGRERRILASANVEKVCRDFARWNALNVIHLWNAPDVVKQFLETGDESLRAAARAAAWAAARDAARDAAREAAWDAAREAAWAAAWDAARDAARAAAWDAARDAARAAAWDAAIKKSRDKFAAMIEEALAQAQKGGQS